MLTGVGGFIGFHLAKRLLGEGHSVIGIDNINNYYDQKLKNERIKILKKNKNFFFFKIDINNKKKLEAVFKKTKPSIVIHLASEVGVRNSTKRPKDYIKTNILGFLNILENCKNHKKIKLFYASSSSVYGNSKKKFIEKIKTDNPLSVYAASKKGVEIFASAYNHLYKFPIIGLRFFTVYGPYGRPDMAIYQFTDSIYRKKPINVYGRGNLERDFTYIDDLVFYISNLINKKFLRHEVFNIGNTKPIKVRKLISIIEKNLGLKAKINFIKTPRTEVHKTSADITKLKKLGLSKKITSIEKGISNFVQWYKKNIKNSSL